MTCEEVNCLLADATVALNRATFAGNEHLVKWEKDLINDMIDVLQNITEARLKRATSGQECARCEGRIEYLE